MTIVSVPAWVVCYDETCGDLCKYLSYFLFTPYVITICSHLVALIDNDQYFCISSYVFLGFAYFYSIVMAPYIGVERHADYSHDAHGCTAPAYAVPDAWFVSTMTYVLAFFYGVVSDESRRRRFFERHRLLSALAVIGVSFYVTATLTSRYFLPWQLAVNVFIVFVSATLYTLAYWAIVGSVRGATARNWLAPIFNTNRGLFTRPMRIRRRFDSTEAAEAKR